MARPTPNGRTTANGGTSATRPLDPVNVKAILDTSVVIATQVPQLDGELAIHRGYLGGAAFRRPHRQRAGGELRAERLRRLSILQRKFDPLPFDEAVAASYGQLAAAESVAAGRQPRARVMDLLIAATAHAHSARLYTRATRAISSVRTVW